MPGWQRAFRGQQTVQNIHKRPTTIIAAAFVLLACAAQAENAYEIMTGGSSSRTASTMALSYGENPAADFPPKTFPAARWNRQTASPASSTAASFCVRTCDGRYFPVPSGSSRGSAEVCQNLCPAGETKVFFGSSIDSAASTDGKAYTALPHAFRYREELVAGCTCNGKDVVGLASVSLREDRTLRRGDIVASANGLEVVKRIDGGHPSLAKASAARVKYERPRVLASD